MEIRTIMSLDDYPELFDSLVVKLYRSLSVFILTSLQDWIVWAGNQYLEKGRSSQNQDAVQWSRFFGEVYPHPNDSALQPIHAFRRLNAHFQTLFPQDIMKRAGLFAN
jgi:hypothetical protein